MTLSQQNERLQDAQRGALVEIDNLREKNRAVMAECEELRFTISK